jgi:hypothetical protein
MRRSALALALLIASPALAQQMAPYLTDILEQPAHRASFNSLVAASKPPSWLKTFTKTGHGVNGPAKHVSIAGASYSLFFVCKPHDCGDNKMNVLFSSDGTHAWGAIIERRKGPRFLGSPDAGQRDALMKDLR